MNDNSKFQAESVPRASTILGEAGQKTEYDRQREYGDVLANFSAIAGILSEVLTAAANSTNSGVTVEVTGGVASVQVDPVMVVPIMQAIKLARQAANPSHRDTIVDQAGYARTQEMLLDAINNKYLIPGD